MPHPRSRKRTLLMVLLLLTGGAIINVAVAWGCVVSSAMTWAPEWDVYYRLNNNRIAQLYQGHGFGSNSIICIVAGMYSLGGDIKFKNGLQGLPAWFVTDKSAPDSPPIRVDVRGWPT